MTVHFQYELLRKRRKELNMTQEMLAEFCGCSPRYLRNLEAGKKRNPSAILVRRMAFVLEISMEELLVIREETWNWTNDHYSSVWSWYA